MSSDFYNSVEPFPLFVDSAPPNSANYFSSPMAMAAVQLLASSTSSDSSYTGILKPRIILPATLSNYIRLRYYQYEVTFGLYCMSQGEKMVFNVIILTICTSLLYAVSWGLQVFLISSLCRVIYYLDLMSSLPSAPELCASQ